MVVKVIQYYSTTIDATHQLVSPISCFSSTGIEAYRITDCADARDHTAQF